MQRRFYNSIRRIIRQRQAPHQAMATQLTMVVAVGQARKTFAQVQAGLTHMIHKAVLQHGVEYCQPGRSHQRITVVSTFQLAHVEATGFAPCQQRCEGHPAAQAFAEGDDVGTYAVLLLSEQGAATAHAGLYFVENQQDPQFTAQTLNAFEVMLGRRNDARFALDRFEQDGDGLRIGLNRDLRFTDADRQENIRRASELAALLVENGQIVILAMIAPLVELREVFAQRLGEDYRDVWCSASLAVCEQRDPKGHYARARRGDLAGFTGVSAPYQPPTQASLVLDTGAQTVEACLDRLLTWLGECSVLPHA